MRAYKLEAVAVAGSEHAFPVSIFAGCRKRTEYVVSFKTFAFYNAVAEQREQLFKRCHLLRKLRRHTFSVRFIARIFFMAERRGAHIECNGNGIRL